MPDTARHRLDGADISAAQGIAKATPTKPNTVSVRAKGCPRKSGFLTSAAKDEDQ
jgi:hypothetical protein